MVEDLCHWQLSQAFHRSEIHRAHFLGQWELIDAVIFCAKKEWCIALNNYHRLYSHSDQSIYRLALLLWKWTNKLCRDCSTWAMCLAEMSSTITKDACHPCFKPKISRRPSSAWASTKPFWNHTEISLEYVQTKSLNKYNLPSSWNHTIYTFSKYSGLKFPHGFLPLA